MRNRLEDFGRILVMLNQVIESPLFSRKEHMRTKDFADYFFNWSADCQWEWVNRVAYEIEELKESLIQIANIAEGIDELNREPDGYIG
jgi:hypothetical protein